MTKKCLTKENVCNSAHCDTNCDLGEDPAPTLSSLLSVDYETRDGSAKNGKDYHSFHGMLVSAIKLKQCLGEFLLFIKMTFPNIFCLANAWVYLVLT